jgi:hypothetical protein
VQSGARRQGSPRFGRNIAAIADSRVAHARP